MRPPQFLVPREQYFSSQFLGWSTRNASRAQEEQTRHLFLLARYALYHGLRALGIARGDEVLFPAYICQAAVEAIDACEAVPAFFQIRRDCSIDFEDLQRRLSPRTRAILVVHYFGFPQDLQQVREFADRHELLLIEDCAHVLRGELAGSPLGSIGDASIFSWRKFLPTPYGAELVLNARQFDQPALRPGALLFDLKILKYILEMQVADGMNPWARSLVQFPSDLIQWSRKIFRGSGQEGQWAKLAGQTNSSGFDPELAQSKVSRIPRWILARSDVAAIAAKRRHNYEELTKRLAGIPGVHPLFPSLPENNCPLYFPLFVDDVPGAHRKLRELGIPATAWDGVRPPAVSDDSFPDAGFLYENLVFLPVHQNLRERDLDLMSDAVAMVSEAKMGAPAFTAAAGRSNVQSQDARPQAVPEYTATKHQETASDKKDLTRKVLLVAFHFPPQTGSSGQLRSLKYCRYLPENEWLPRVLTAHPWAYEQVDDSLVCEIPSQVHVTRAFALDARKHLSLRGRYSRYTALPDRWTAWCLGAIPAGVFQIYKNKIDVILTTFPIASAVLIGYLLHRVTGVPWVADFRDPMTEDHYPRDPRIRRMYRWLEKKAVKHASRLIFTAPSTRQLYMQRYPELAADKCLVISNGFDEEDFTCLQPTNDRQPGTPLRLVHSGLIYPEERDPIPFFEALAQLKSDQRISASRVSVDLRACGNEERYREIVARLGIKDLVHFLPPLPYQQALQDSNAAEALLLLQAACCDHQIPAKAYEYLRLGKPILALTSNTGDTAALLNECGGATIVDIANMEAIYKALPDFLTAVQTGTHPLPNHATTSKYSRQSQARELARCLSEIVADDMATAAVATVKQSNAER